MKWLKRVSLFFLFLILLAFLIIWVLTKNINSDTIKQLVNKQISTLTHKKSQIDGVISWQLFPRPGLKFTQVEVGDKATECYALSIDSLLLKLKISPLFRGDFVFSEINLDGIKLVIDADLPEKAKLENQNSKPVTNKNDKHQFAFEHILVSHGEITINKNGHKTVFKNIQMGMEQFNLKNQSFPVQLKAKLTLATAHPITKAQFNFKGRFNLSPKLIEEFSTGAYKSSAEGQLVVSDVLFNEFSIKKINATLKTNSTDIMFNPITFFLYNGESIGDMNYAFATHQLSVNQTATNLDGKLLLTALSGEDKISGNLDYSIHAIIPLDKTGIENLMSTGNITIKEGELLNIDMKQMLIDLRDKLTSLVNNKSFLKSAIQLASWDKNKYRLGNTPFKLASFHYQLQNGIINSDSIILQTDALQLKGVGSLNLLNKELHSKLNASINNSTDNVGQKIQNLLGGNFPLVISGTLDEPVILPDFKLIISILSSREKK